MRIFDISNVETPVQVGQVQTCRGSHTHTLVTDKHSKKYVYIYVQGTAGVRPPEELAGCDGNNTFDADRTETRRSGGSRSSRSRVASPENAAIVNEPRLFADPATGAVNGLQNAPQTPLHPSGMAVGPDADHGRLPRHHRVSEVRDRGGRL